MIDLHCEYSTLRFISLYVIILSRMHFRVNSHSIATSMSKNKLVEGGAKFEIELTNPQTLSS